MPYLWLNTRDRIKWTVMNTSQQDAHMSPHIYRKMGKLERDKWRSIMCVSALIWKNIPMETKRHNVWRHRGLHVLHDIFHHQLWLAHKYFISSRSAVDHFGISFGLDLCTPSEKDNNFGSDHKSEVQSETHLLRSSWYAVTSYLYFHFAFKYVVSKFKVYYLYLYYLIILNQLAFKVNSIS